MGINSCEYFADHKYSIKIRNLSDITIEVFAVYILPDTTLPVSQPELREIKPENTGQIYDSDVNDEGLKRFKNEMLTIFFISKDTISRYTWEEIVQDYKILKRVELNQSNLSDMGGSIIYL